MIIFIGGPAFSGKSEWLIKNAEKIDTLWIATGDTTIEPMRQRHAFLQDMRRSRGEGIWRTIETSDVLSSLELCTSNQIVIDCTTAWLATRSLEINMRHSLVQLAQILANESKKLLTLLKQQSSLGRSVWVTGGEIGACLPSSNPIERLIRESNGRLNQQICQIADEVIRLDFGIPTKIKTIT